MNFAVVQTREYQGQNWWKWSLWIAGSDKDLDAIESVTYHLHPTFADPVRTVTDRSRRFQLRSEGWGIFTIPIEVRLRDGTAINLRHQLQFSLPEVEED